jgi:RNA polymerase sigma-70 factor (ECF subfamily)
VSPKRLARIAMPQLSSLADVYIGALRSQGLQAARRDRPALEHLLEAAIRDACERWPRVQLDAKSLVATLPRHTGNPTAAALRKLRVDDLLLVGACLSGDGEAWRYFERDFLAPLERRLESEVYDRLRRAVVAPGPGRESLLWSYSGRARISTWLYGIARLKTHEARRENRRRESLSAVETAEESHAPCTAEADPELAFLRRHFSAELKAAVRETLRSLPPDERGLLREHLLQHRSVDDIGARHGIHRATAARRLARIRRQLSEHVHDALHTRLGLTPREASKLRELVQDQLDLSITRLL